MTKQQRITLMADWWPKACEAQKWKASDRELRLRVLSEAVRRPLKSATDLNTTSDIDKVKAHLLTLADNVEKAAEQEHEGAARRTMHNVRLLLAELEDLHPEPGTYVMTIIRGITSGRYGVSGVEDLHTGPRLVEGQPKKISELEQFHLTLNARIHGANGLKNNPQKQTEPVEEKEEVPF